MATSIRDRSILEALEQALTPTTETVVVDGRAVDIVKPFPSPADWRDHWIYFLMIDRFNNPAAPPRHLPFDARFGELARWAISFR